MKFSPDKYVLNDFSFFQRIILRIAYLSKKILYKLFALKLAEIDTYEYVHYKGGEIQKEDTYSIITIPSFQYQNSYAIHLRNHTSDFLVFKEIFITEQYHQVVSAYINMLGKQEDGLTIIDAGANIGSASIYFKSLFRNAKIICVEPDEANFQQLSKNIQANNHSNIHLLKNGIWINNKPLKVESGFRDGKEWSFTIKEVDNEKESDLKGITIETIITEFNINEIDILKMDIEGSEKFLFEKEECINQFLPKTKILAIEVHEEFISRDKITSILKKYNFNFTFTHDFILATNKKFLN